MRILKAHLAAEELLLPLHVDCKRVDQSEVERGHVAVLREVPDQAEGLLLDPGIDLVRPGKGIVEDVRAVFLRQGLEIGLLHLRLVAVPDEHCVG